MKGGGNNKPITTAKLVATALKMGLSLSDLDEITLGMLLDIMRAFAGEDDSAIDEKYNRLKAIEKMVEEGYKNGEISQEKYNHYRKALQEYEGAS